MKTEASSANLVFINCPCCMGSQNAPWDKELGFSVVRCSGCGLLYVNPRPLPTDIDTAVREGQHSLENKQLDVRSRRVPRKIPYYRSRLGSMFPELWRQQKSIVWVDVGAGYGETLEAVRSLAPKGSSIVGVEPMKHKANMARAQGLQIQNSYLEPSMFEADVISMVDIFSHIPDFHSFLQVVAKNLKPGGEVFIETGNLADLEFRSQFPNELGVPDHLVFAGESQLMRYVAQAGFEVVRIRRQRIDGIVFFVKTLVKKMLGRPVVIGMPYTSRYRQLLVRARLK